MFEKDAIAKTPNPRIIFINCGNANGFHAPPPAEYKITSDIIKIKHIGTNIDHEKRFSFSEKLIIFAFETRVCLGIVLFVF